MNKTLLFWKFGSKIIFQINQSLEGKQACKGWD